MEPRQWSSWDTLKSEKASGSVEQRVNRTWIPPTDAPGAVADTSGAGPSYTCRYWESPPTSLNATYLDLSPQVTENIPGYTGSIDSVYDSLLPNYKRLELLNRGFWNGTWENKEALHTDDNWRVADAIMCQLEMTDYQKERFHYLFWKLDRGKLGLSTEQVAFAVCMLVCREDGRKSSPRYKDWDTEFDRFVREQGYQNHFRYFERIGRILRKWLKGKDQRRIPPKPPSHPVTTNTFSREPGYSTDSSAA